MQRAFRVVIASSIVAIAAVAGPQAATPADAACGVSINRIYYDSPGSDTGSNTSLNAE